MENRKQSLMGVMAKKHLFVHMYVHAISICRSTEAYRAPMEPYRLNLFKGKWTYIYLHMYVQYKSTYFYIYKYVKVPLHKWQCTYICTYI